MRRETTAVVLFTGDVRREERRKRLPRRLLTAIHADVEREVGRAIACDLFVCGDQGGVTGLAGIFPAGGMPVAAQIAGTLAALFGSGYEQVLVIAGDVASLRARHVAEASRHLRERPGQAVIGPCRDGGFYLAGFNQAPELDWSALPWFGPTIGDELTGALSTAGFAVEQLETLDDIDSPGDARRVAADRSLRIHALMRSLLCAPLAMAVRVTPVRSQALVPALRRRPPPLAA